MNSHRYSSRWVNMKKKRLIASALLSTAVLSGCTVTLAQPYDAELYKNTEDFYKNAATLLLKGERASPVSKQQLSTLRAKDARQHPGHFSRFQAEYDELLVESNTLILRALTNAGALSEPGKQLHARVEQSLEEQLGNQCDVLQRDFPDADLTTRNYVDLKCLVSRWQHEHQQASYQVLNKAIWQNRKNTLFDSILAIQAAAANTPSSRINP
ncbi:hypothetical protein [Pseudomonas putida]|uniref:Lipoprotein n=1 Tax=Pseudomonas putida TaxID=303 RepID=A0A6I6XM15_PSEPU|nr:hypothetical protein [Pseudomonas putida]QHG64931.2 hypothetical protein C2H86_11125 [Pseudomonas putida]